MKETLSKKKINKILHAKITFVIILIIIITFKCSTYNKNNWEAKQLSGDVLKLGPTIGYTSSSSTRIWIFTEAEQIFDVIIYTDEKRRSIVTKSKIETKKEDGFTGVVDIYELKANTKYYYDIKKGSNSVIPTELINYCKFKTFPKDNSSFNKMRFMITSGHKPFSKYSVVMWEVLARQIQKEPIDFMLLLGDQVYNDKAYWETIPSEREYKDILENEVLRSNKEEEIRNAYRQNYYKFWNFFSMRKVFAMTPTFMILDDHEIRNAWGSCSADSEPIPQFMYKQAIKVYKEFQGSLNPHSYKNELYYNFNYGDIAFFVLDLRGYRNLNKAIKDKPLMGKKQWNNFITWLFNSGTEQKKVLFLGLSIPLVSIPNWIVDFLADKDVKIDTELRDRWNYKINKPEMVQLINNILKFQNETNTKIYPMGGDVHVSFLSKIIKEDNFSLENYTISEDDIIYEFSSSGITNNDNSSQAVYPQIKDLFYSDKSYITKNIYAQLQKLVNKLNYGIVEVSKTENNKYKVNYYVISRNKKSPAKANRHLLYSSR